jgi:hypothetical protein
MRGSTVCLRTFTRGRPAAMILALALIGTAVCRADFDEHFTLRQGDLESDGVPELYLRHTAPLALLGFGALRIPVALDRRSIAEFVLRKNGDAFSVDSTVSALTLSAARQWPSAPGLAAALADFNSDAQVDALIKRTGSASAFGPVSLPMLIAPQAATEPPSHITAIDAAFEAAIDALRVWLFDRAYFDVWSAPSHHEFIGNGLTYSDYLALWGICDRYFDYCYGRHGDLNILAPLLFGIPCSAYVAAIGTWGGNPCRIAYHVWGADAPVVTQDFSEVPPVVADIVRAADGLWSGSARVADVTVQLERLLQTRVGGLDFSDLQLSDDLDDLDEQQDFEFVQAIASIWHALRGRPTKVDTIYLTAHPVLRVGPQHTALEYLYTSGTPLGSAGPQIVSAGPLSGRLVYSRNRKSDHGNFVLGPVQSARYSTAKAHFDTLIRSAENYDNQLDYDLFPEAGDGYNSNSFVAGLLDITAASATHAMSSFVGGGKPVPAKEFE